MGAGVGRSGEGNPVAVRYSGLVCPLYRHGDPSGFQRIDRPGDEPAWFLRLFRSGRLNRPASPEAHPNVRHRDKKHDDRYCKHISGCQ